MVVNRIAIAAVAGMVVLVGAGLFIHQRRPKADLARGTAEAVKGTGVCIECHRTQTAGIVHQWQDSRHALKGITCFDCHKPLDEAHKIEHKGFQITRYVTSGRCAECHKDEYAQFLKSRHAASAWTAVAGTKDFTAAQLADARKTHPEGVDREAHPLVALEGAGALQAGCKSCHEVGAPNYDQSVGNCTKCHGKHAASVAMARTSDTCGSCHMGPDHSQIEIWRESPHGVMFVARRDKQDLAFRGELSADQQDTPTCSTCHFSGMGGVEPTHDVGERLSYYLFAAISEKRPNFTDARRNMRNICLNCHSSGHVDRFFQAAEVTLVNTNEQVKKSQAIMEALYKEGLLTKQGFDEPIEFLAFDLWHYFGRTAKHGAFMGGADFSQWHGNYELQAKLVELRAQADELRRRKK